MALVQFNGKDESVIIDALTIWGKNNYRFYPWRSTSNKFHAIIAEMMLQRTKAEQVLDVYTEFSARYKKPEDVCSDLTQNVMKVLQPLGLKWRARKIIDFSTQICKIGSIPCTFDGLMQLPGIGQYVASAFLSLHNNQRCSLIDANTVRVWGRVYGFKTDAETRRQKWFKNLVDKLTPDSGFRDFNYALLDFSGLICKTVPVCKKCPINNVCSSFDTIA